MLALLALGGCSVDPLNTDGRDGGGPSPGYDSLMRVAQAARGGGDYASAIGVYRRASQIDPDRVEPLDGLGATLVESGAVDEGIATYNAALERFPRDPEALRGLAKAYLKTGRPALARVPLQTALEAAPEDPGLLMLLGVTFDMTRQHRLAQGYYRHGLELKRGDPALTTDLALSLALTGDFSSAIATLEPLALGSAATPRERQTLALIYGLQGDRQSAARFASIDLDPADVRQNLAYYESLRSLSPEARSRALLTASAPAPSPS